MVEGLSCVESIVEVDSLTKIPQILRGLSPEVLFVNLNSSIALREFLELARFVREHYQRVGMVALLTHVAPETVHLLIKNGVHGLLDDDATEQDLESAVRASAAGNMFHSRRIYEQNVSADKINQLTASEMQALGLLMQGDTNFLIAQKLNVTTKTVEAHLTRIYRKLDVTSRAQAIIRAQELHLFPANILST